MAPAVTTVRLASKRGGKILYACSEKYQCSSPTACGSMLSPSAPARNVSPVTTSTPTIGVNTGLRTCSANSLTSAVSPRASVATNCIMYVDGFAASSRYGHAPFIIPLASSTVHPSDCPVKLKVKSAIVPFVSAVRSGSNTGPEIVCTFDSPAR